jgi:hypothetical protein
VWRRRDQGLRDGIRVRERQLGGKGRQSQVVEVRSRAVLATRLAGVLVVGYVHLELPGRG